MRIGSLLLISIYALVGCREAVSCLTDSDCAEGAYCRSTQCIKPSAEGDVDVVFESRIRPIVETGCGCHGPDSGRPWSYFSKDDTDEQKLRRALITREWAYDPKPKISDDQTADRPALLGYVTGACGLGHPSVYSDIQAPQYRELELWFGALIEQLAGVATPMTPSDEMANSSLSLLTELDERALNDIKTKEFDEVMKTHIEPRMVANCGCCHDAQGTSGRAWLLNTDFRRGEDEYQQNVLAISGLVVWKDLASSSLFSYGLGQVPNHPQIWMGKNDARAEVVATWIEEGKQPEAPKPIEGAEVWLNTYQTDVAPHFVAACICHGPTSATGWAHSPLDGSPETLQKNLDGLAREIDKTDFSKSALLQYPLGRLDMNHYRPDQTTGLYDGEDDPKYKMVKSWLESLPDSFPAIP